MLQRIREKFTGGFALVILVLIGVPFVFVGINYNFIGNSFAAKVDGTDVSAFLFEQSYRDFLQENPQAAQVGEEIRAQIRRGLLDQLIQQQLVENFLDDMGYRVSDDQLTELLQGVPEFQTNGEFDMELYRTFLAERGQDPTRFEALQRQRMRQNQLQLAIAASAVVTPAEYRRYLNLTLEQRVVTTAAFGEAMVADEIVVTDDMVQAYYDDNSSLYELPETVDIEFIEIRRDLIAEGIEVTEQELADYYDEEKYRFLQDEQRQARHILILFEDDEDAAEAKANDALARLNAGESFEVLATEVSMDGGTSANGGDLGVLSRTQLPGELGGAIFSMNEGDVTGPIKSDFGFHIVRLDDVVDQGSLPLDQVRGELLAELRARSSDDAFRDMDQQLNNASFDTPDMQAISAAVGIEVSSASGFTRAGGEPFGANQAAIDAVFDDGVLTGEQVSEVIELDANSSAIFRVTNYNEPTVRPLAEVREEIVVALTSQQADQLLASRVESMLAAVAGGEAFNVAAEASGAIVAEPAILTRTSEDVAPSLLYSVYAAVKPTAADPVVDRVRNEEGGYTVYSLDAVLPGRPESIPLAERDTGKLYLAQDSGIADFRAFVSALQADAEIIINDDVLAAEDLFQ